MTDVITRSGSLDDGDYATILTNDAEILTDASVSGHEIVKMKSNKRVVFWIDVETEIAAFTVKRRFQAFHDLHTKLAKMFPKSTLPTIPAKGLLRSFDYEHLLERQNLLNNYMTELLLIPEIKGSDTLAEFLENDTDADDASEVSGATTDKESYLTSAIGFLLQPLPKITKKISSRGNYEVSFKIPDRHSVVLWEFRTATADIAMGVTFDDKTVRKYRRFRSHEKVIQGSFSAPRPGVCVIKWDNSYSLLRAKLLSFKVNVVSKESAVAAAAAASEVNERRMDASITGLPMAAVSPAAATLSIADSITLSPSMEPRRLEPIDEKDYSESDIVTNPPSLIHLEESPLTEEVGSKDEIPPVLEINPLAMELEAMRQELAAVKKCVSASTAEAVSMRRERDQLLGEKRVWSFEQSDLQEKLSAMEEERNIAQQNVTKLKLEINEIQTVATELKLESSDLRDTVASSLALETSLRQALKDSTEELTKTRATYDILAERQQKQLESTELLIKTMRTASATTSKALQESVTKFSKLKLQKKLLVTEVKRLKQELEGHEKESRMITPSSLSLPPDAVCSPLVEAETIHIPDSELSVSLGSTLSSSREPVPESMNTLLSSDTNSDLASLSTHSPIINNTDLLDSSFDLSAHRFARVGHRFAAPVLHNKRELDTNATPKAFTSDPSADEVLPSKLGFHPDALSDVDKDKDLNRWGGFQFLASKAKEVAAGLVGGGNFHPDHSCEGCSMTPIRGARWHCTDCDNYDICGVCYMRGVHGHEREDILYPLLSSENQDIMLSMANNSTKKFNLLRSFFSQIDSGKIVHDLPKPGYEIEKLEPEIVSRFLRHILPVLQLRPEVTVHTEILPQSESSRLKKLRIRCTLLDDTA